tara:strand:- start:33 stop:293 length:261 start_codon:yes stop_codon:yes gene_type:complete
MEFKSKKNYILTPCECGYKVEVWDNYGKYTCVYEKTREDASNYILNWWEMSEKNKKKDDLWHQAMLEMIEIDKKYNINKGNRDGLD